MPRVHSASSVAPPVRVISSDAVLWLDELTRILGLPRTALKREARQGRLRVSRRCGRYMVRGEWVRDWIEQGPGAPRRKEPTAAEACT